MASDLHSQVCKSTPGRTPSCNLLTPATASQLPISLSPAASRYFEIVWRHVSSITEAGRMIESGSLFLLIAGRTLKALKVHDQVKIALQPACCLIAITWLQNAPGRCPDRHNCKTIIRFLSRNVNLRRIHVSIENPYKNFFFDLYKNFCPELLQMYKHFLKVIDPRRPSQSPQTNMGRNFLQSFNFLHH